MNSGGRKPHILKFKNIDNIINKIADGLRKFVGEMYNEISELNYNIETIITGVDKHNNPTGYKMDDYYKEAEVNMNNIKDKLDVVKNKISLNVKRKFGK
jgi:archaellum component FlaC